MSMSASRRKFVSTSLVGGTMCSFADVCTDPLSASSHCEELGDRRVLCKQ